MPDYLAPGVFVEETSFRAKSIEGVATGTAAFVGPTRTGPVASAEVLPECLTSVADFERLYGGVADLQLAVASPADARPVNHLARAVRAFFGEGGARLYVARVFDPEAGLAGIASTADLRTGAGLPAEDDTDRIRFVARFPGRCGNGAVPTAAQPALHGIQTREVLAPAPPAVLDAAPPGSLARTGVADPFGYLLKREGGWFAMAADGTVADDAAAVPSAALADASLVTLTVVVTDGEGRTVTVEALGLDASHPRFVGAVLSSAAEGGPIETPYVLSLGSRVKARQLLDALFPAAQNPPAVRAAGRLGAFELTGGDDGAMPSAAAYAPAFAALAMLGDVSIVAAPGSSTYADRDAIRRALIAHVEGPRRYRFAVLDTDAGLDLAGARATRAPIDSTHAALYHPWVVVAEGGREITLPPSGFVCGIYARCDRERGVFKAPANEVVRGALRFERNVSNAEQQVLNPLGVNCLRFFAGRGNRVWGARTTSSDPEWKYVNVRRYFLYLEASIDRGTQWVVFEPNGERLWADVRRMIEDFLLNEWRNGALMGSTAKDAFFVRCDRTTMTQDDIDNGRLVCLVGVAPVKPAEFIIFRIGQRTAETNA